MRKIAVLHLLLGVLLACAISAPAAAQGRIFTKKARIADFPGKTTKVVLSGNPMLDKVLQEEICSRWNVSPYEFCTLGEFDELVSNPSYYFLRFSYREKEEGIISLSLLKGGTSKTRGTTDTIYEALHFPLMAEQMPDGRELVYLPAVIEIIQTYMQSAIQSDRVGYFGLNSFNLNLPDINGKTLWFCSEDLTGEAKLPDGKFEVRENSREIDRIFVQGTEGAVVGRVVKPAAPSWNAKYFVMLIDARSHALLYFRKGKFRDCLSGGFSARDLRLFEKLID